MKNEGKEYSRAIKRFHWISAVLIISLVPMGYIMQGVDSNSIKSSLYFIHVFMGVIVLPLTIARVIRVFYDGQPKLPPGLSKGHAYIFYANHVLLIVSILFLSISGIVILAKSELWQVLNNSPLTAVPEYLTRLTTTPLHSLWVLIFFLLLVMHVAGIFWHQFTRSDVMSRMGWKGWKTKRTACEEAGP